MHSKWIQIGKWHDIVAVQTEVPPIIENHDRKFDGNHVMKLDVGPVLQGLVWERSNESKIDYDNHACWVM